MVGRSLVEINSLVAETVISQFIPFYTLFGHGAITFDRS